MKDPPLVLGPGGSSGGVRVGLAAPDRRDEVAAAGASGTGGMASLATVGRCHFGGFQGLPPSAGRPRSAWTARATASMVLMPWLIELLSSVRTAMP